jgi:hypothetical protein
MTTDPCRLSDPAGENDSGGKEVVMAVMTNEPATDQPESRDVLARVLVPEFWGSLTIIVMWLAVLFVGVFGGNMVFNAPPNLTTIPVAFAVAIFAAIGTWGVARRVFSRRTRG